MRPFIFLTIAILTAATFATLASADDKREPKARFKGVELYSWKDKAGEWVFVMLDGTNNEKDELTVKGSKNQIKGTADLKKALALLAVGEQVSWSHRIKGFEFPSAEIRKEIKKAADDAKIVLRIGDEE